MLDLELIMNQIEEKGIVDFTTKELLYSGLNKYYIKKAIAEGRLQKVSKGKYKVVSISEKKRSSSFWDFVHCVFQNDFENAYAALVVNLENQLDHSYGNHLRIYFILLCEILGYDTEAIKMNEQLLEFSEYDYSYSKYYQHFIKFREAVMSGNLKKAYAEICTFKKLEKIREGNNTVSAKVFCHLTTAAIFRRNMIEDREKGSLDNQQIQSIRENHERMYKSFFKSFMKAYQAQNYEYALQLLRDVLSYSSSDNRASLEQLIEILTAYVAMNKGDIVLLEKNLNYEMFGDDCNSILQYALDNQDYFTAYQYIGKCMENNPEHPILKLSKEVLTMMVAKTKSDIDTKDQNSSEVRDELVPKITVQFVYELVSNQDYDRLYEILNNRQQVEENDRLFYFVTRMLYDMKHLVNLKQIYEEQTISYQHPSYYSFKRFFEALRYKDYSEAYQLVITCEQISKKNKSDDLELTIYRLILEELLKKIEVLQSKSDQVQRLVVIQNEINSYLSKSRLSQEDIACLYQLLSEKLECAIEEVDVKYDEYAIELINILNLSREQKLNATYFEQFCYSGNDIVTSFFQAIQFGDYISAFNFITNEQWFSQTKGFSNTNKGYLILYKRLLSRLYMEWVRTPKKEKAFQLSILRDMLEREDYARAYQYHQSHLNQYSNLELKEMLDVFFSVARQSETVSDDVTRHEEIVESAPKVRCLGKEQH